MKSRIVLAAPVLALAFAAAPVAAKSGTARMAEDMKNPATQRAMAAAVAAASEAMLDIPLEPLARAAEAMGDHRTARRMRGATLGDVAGPEARDMPREISRKLPAMMGAAGGMAASIEEMTPALKAMAREMGARMSEAMRGADTAGDYDRDYRDHGADAPSADDAPPAAQDEADGGPYATPAPDQDGPDR